MKQFVLALALSGAAFTGTRAQMATALAEQLAALQALQQTVGQGYRLMTNGLAAIGQITGGEFQLHQAYFGSLDTAAAVVLGDPKVIALQQLQLTIVREINAALEYWRRQQSSIIKIN